ncbi:hypothetical protein CCYA_CCYA02G0786 [Cyanidiococcus yangmingshanensis]|nr:hypothetical protein CCYA_CCYA02G0786 [Cyanidiococcus yangmingshanensis]
MNVWLLGRGDNRRRQDEVLQLERAFLTDRTGLEFVNSQSTDDLLAVAESARAQRSWPLLDPTWISPVGTDSCDDLVWQNLENTLDSRLDTFYSTSGFETGSTLGGANELAPGEALLVYRFWRPVRVYAVQLRVFQADFHPGRPLYPFQIARLGVGCSLQGGISMSYDLEPSASNTSVNYRCAPTTQLQTFTLDEMMVGTYLVICLQGFPQQQLTDRLHYAALSEVRVFGEPVAPPQVESQLTRLLRSGISFSGRDAAAWLRAETVSCTRATLGIDEEEPD